jgi:hypothetical protein
MGVVHRDKKQSALVRHTLIGLISNLNRMHKKCICMKHPGLVHKIVLYLTSMPSVMVTCTSTFAMQLEKMTSTQWQCQEHNAQQKRFLVACRTTIHLATERTPDRKAFRQSDGAPVILLMAASMCRRVLVCRC